MSEASAQAGSGRAGQSSRRTRVALSGLWWFVLSALGLFFPFYSLYLREGAGLSGTEVGLVMATVPAVGVLVQPIWGQIADRTGARTRVVAMLAAGTAVGYLGLVVPATFWGFFTATLLLALFTGALIPNCVSVSWAALPEASAKAFGRVRVMGTLGYGVSVALAPYALRTLSGGSADDPASLRHLFPIASALVAMAAATALLLPTTGSVVARAERDDWRKLLHNQAFLRVLAFTFLTFFLTQGAMVLFPILVSAQGGGVESISRMWLVMLALEVPLVFVFGASVDRVGARGVLAIGTLAAMVRWTTSGFVDDLAWVTAAQVLHGVTVWGIILGVPYYVDRVVPENLRATAQGVLAMAGISLGSILSNVCAGWLMETVDEATPARVAGLASGLLLLLLPFVVAPLTVAVAAADEAGSAR